MDHFNQVCLARFEPCGWVGGTVQQLILLYLEASCCHKAAYLSLIHGGILLLTGMHMAMSMNVDTSIGFFAVMAHCIFCFCCIAQVQVTARCWVLPQSFALPQCRRVLDATPHSSKVFVSHQAATQ